MGFVACCIVLHSWLTGKWPLAAFPDILDAMCSSVAKLRLAPNRTLSNRWRHERLRMLEKAATAMSY